MLKRAFIVYAAQVVSSLSGGSSGGCGNSTFPSQITFCNRITTCGSWKLLRHDSANAFSPRREPQSPFVVRISPVGRGYEAREPKQFHPHSLPGWSTCAPIYSRKIKHLKATGCRGSNVRLSTLQRGGHARFRPSDERSSLQCKETHRQNGVLCPEQRLPRHH